MDLTVILQVAVGMIFVWIILAVITSQIQEWVANIFIWRANMLENTIAQMLGNQTLKDRIYNHPLIKGLYTNEGKRKPAGIPQDKFALVLFEEVMKSGVTVTDAKNTFERLKQSVAAIKNADGSNELKDFATSLDTLLIGIEEKADDATHAIAEARARVESWFDNSMDRLGGAYRRRTQIVSLIVGISVAAVLNVDSAAILNTLWKDPVIRQAVAVQANQALQENAQANPTPGPEQTPEPNATPEPTQQAGQAPNVEQIAATVEKLNQLSLPIGWSENNRPKDAGGWVAKIIGILLSGMAGAQGAPYWFDLMRKLVTRNPPVPPQPA